MVYTAVMVYVDTGSHCAVRIGLACDIAKLFDARLIGVSASTPQRPATLPVRGGIAVNPDIGPFLDRAEADLRCAEDLFHRVARTRSCRFEWRSSIDNPGDFVAGEARAADLILVGRVGNDVSSHHAADPADLIRRAGRPVLVVPTSIEFSPLGSHAVVAWKDCRAARRAMLDAVPLLVKSSKVSVFDFAAAERREMALRQANDVATFLAHHGVRSEAVVLPDDGRSTAQQILHYANARRTGLIVMGAQSHVRLHDWAIGGETYDMLRKCSICLLLSN